MTDCLQTIVDPQPTPADPQQRRWLKKTGDRCPVGKFAFLDRNARLLKEAPEGDASSTDVTCSRRQFQHLCKAAPAEPLTEQIETFHKKGEGREREHGQATAGARKAPAKT